MDTRIKELTEENQKLRSALAGLIPWAGCSPNDPSWATQDAKKKNQQMFDEALNTACECFPDDYNGFNEMIMSN